jgi:hypothetical protein
VIEVPKDLPLSFTTWKTEKWKFNGSPNNSQSVLFSLTCPSDMKLARHISLSFLHYTSRVEHFLAKKRSVSSLACFLLQGAKSLLTSHEGDCHILFSLKLA